MPTDKLSDTAVKKAKPGEKPVRMFDGGGLYLEVATTGGKLWRLKYRFGGKEKLLSMGTYPDTGLQEARERRNAARKLLAAGIDPSAARKAEKLGLAAAAASSFEAVAREWHGANVKGWSERHATNGLQRLVIHVFPHIGKQPLAAITAPDILGVIRKVEAQRKHETAHTIAQQCRQIFRYGIATGRCTLNPVPDLRDALQPKVVTHMPAVTDPKAVGGLMRAMADYQGHPVTRAALALSALTFQRPGNVRAAEWSEVDLDAAMWTVPSEKMKRTVQAKISGKPHLVPLSSQAVAQLRTLHEITGHGRFLFPSLLTGERCMSENTVNTALRRMGYAKDDMTAHGFRAMARTLMVEHLNINPEAIEAQLAHGKSGPLGMAYDRAQFMEQRQQMMQAWADYLDKLRDGAEIIPMKAA